MRNVLPSTKFESLAVTDTGLQGVLVIQEGPAKGHFCVKEGNRLIPCDWDNADHLKAEKFQVWIDRKMLEQVVSHGNSGDEVPSYLNHGDVIGDVVGGYTKFRIDGPAVRADWMPMESHDRKNYVFELARRFANRCGNSIDFTPTYEIKEINGKKVAACRCGELKSVDFVKDPAATNSLFAEGEGTEESPNNKDMTKEEFEAVMAPYSKKVDALGERFSAIEAKFTEGDKDDDEDEDKKKKSDDDSDAKEDDDEGDDKKNKKEDDEKLQAKLDKMALSAAQKARVTLGQKIPPVAGSAPPVITVERTADEEVLHIADTRFKGGAHSIAQAKAFIGRTNPELYAQIRF